MNKGDILTVRGLTDENQLGLVIDKINEEFLVSMFLTNKNVLVDNNGNYIKEYIKIQIDLLKKS